MYIMPRIIVLLALLFGALLSVYPTAKRSIRYLGIEHGLSNNYVTAIFQDRHGFMWFGTQNGLNRYDGYQFVVYNHHPGNSASLADNRITDITADRSDRIWVAMKKGVSVLDGRGNVTGHMSYQPTAAASPVSIDFAINELQLDAEGYLFAASERDGLLRVDTRSDRYDEAVQIPLAVEGKKRFGYHAQTVKADKDGNIWLVVHGVGLCRFEPQIQEVRLVSADVRSVSCMMPDDLGNIWMGTDRGLIQYNIAGKRTRIIGLQDGLSSTNIAALYSDGAQQLWVCTDGGGITIMHIPSGRCTYLAAGDHSGTLTSNAVFSVFRDAASRYWIGTLRGGINVIDPKISRFQTIRHGQALYGPSAKDFILSFAEDRSGDVWIGTDGAGLTFWNRRQDTFVHYQHDPEEPGALSSDFVTNVLVDQYGELWAATYGGGINRLDKRTGTFKRYACLDQAQEHEYTKVWKLYEDRSGTLWAGTLAGGGLYRFNRKNDRFELYDATINNVLTIWEDNDHTLWFGTFSDVIRFNRGTGQTARYRIGHPIRFIHQSGPDSLWIGTEGGGLLHFEKQTGSYQSFTETNGLPDNVMLNALEDESGHLWMSTFNGIAKFNPKTKAVRNFFQSDGLQSNQFNYNAAFGLRSGEFLFGGIHGFNVFHPDSISSVSAMPKLVLTDLRINNRPYDRSSRVASVTNLQNIDRLILGYDEAVISFGFAALEYASPDKIRYAYILEGWDKDWNHVGSQRTAHYSRLEPGTYTLRIRSTNADGKWNPQERIVSINVLPPWWQTKWAYGLFISLILGAGYVYLHYDRRQTRLRYEVKMARLAMEKEKELNEKKLAFFTHISHEFRAPLTLIINPIKEMLYSNRGTVDNRELATVYNNSRRLLSLVDQLLLFQKADDESDAVRFAKLDIVALCKEVFLCFAQYAESKGVSYQFTCFREQLEIYVDREKMEVVLYNLISNALKFTPKGGSVMVSIEEAEPDRLQISVRDSGCGIPEHIGNAIFNRFYRDFSGAGKGGEGFGIGLYLVKKFVEAHQGSVSYISREGEGTSFSVTLLKGKQHLANSYIFEDIGEHSVFLEELLGQAPGADQPAGSEVGIELKKVTQLASPRPLLLIVDDNEQIRSYVRQIFEDDCVVHEAASGTKGLELVRSLQPDIVLSDVVMEGCSGIELCTQLKNDPSLNHIPIILLTASSAAEIKLKGIESGADDYITKPFDKAILQARVFNILKSRNQLQQYFYNEVTLQSNDFRIAPEYRDFLERCIAVVERHMDNPHFTVAMLAAEMSMSQSNLYKRVKSISGRSTNEFIRFIRLRKVAQLLISTDSNISEAAFAAGFNDMKYFREQFQKLFGVKPSQYKKKFQATMGKKYTLNDRV